MRPSVVLVAKRDQVIAIAAARGVRVVRVCGSAARGGDRADSGIGLSIDIPPDTPPVQVVGLRFDIEDASGARVDLCTEREREPALRRRILAEARAL